MGTTLLSSKPASRLYVPAPLRTGQELRLDDERAHYVARVLRLRVGDGLVLFDGGGSEYPATIAEASKQGIVLRVGEGRERNVESPLPIVLVQGISRGERMDFVVQKATELGVHRITPLVTAFSVVRLDGDRGEKRRVHWSKIAASACEQCGRNLVPVIDMPQSFGGWLDSGTSSGATRILLHPAARQSLAGFERRPEGIELLIGPEGGLSDPEVVQAEAAGFSPCSLGPRTLRTETAAIAAIAVLQARWGDFAG